MKKSNDKKASCHFKHIWLSIKNYFEKDKNALITGIICTVIGGLIVGAIMNQRNFQNSDSSINRNDTVGINETDNQYYFSMRVTDFISNLKETDISNFQYGYKLEGTTKTTFNPEDLSMIPETSYKKVQSFSCINGYTGESPIVVVPEYVSDTKVETIGDDAFNSNKRTAFQSLKLVVLCEGIRYIGDKAFAGNYDLQYIVIPSTVTEISETAFDDCPNVILLVRNNSYVLNYCKLNSLIFQEL